MKQNTSDANMYKRQLSIEEKHTRSRGTDNCCADEATRSRGRYRDKDGGGGGQREKQGKKQERREKILNNEVAGIHYLYVHSIFFGDYYIYFLFIYFCFEFCHPTMCAIA